MHLGKSVPHDLFGLAGAFSTLGGDFQGVADFPVVATALLDGTADLAVGDAFTETDVHVAYL